MHPLTETTQRVIERLFARTDHDAARAVLQEECGAKLPFADTLGEAGIERVRLAVIKLSEGHLTKLDAMARQAQVDWRDVLVWAGFGQSLAAHGACARETLETRLH